MFVDGDVLNFHVLEKDRRPINVSGLAKLVDEQLEGDSVGRHTS